MYSRAGEEKPMIKRDQHHWKAILFSGVPVICFFFLFPFMVDTEESYLVYFLFLTFIYISMAQGWNLVAGYAGQASLGQHAFFGLGAYVTAIAWNLGWIGYMDPVGMLMSGAGAALLAVTYWNSSSGQAQGGLFCAGHPGARGNSAGNLYAGRFAYGRSGGAHAPFF